MTDLPAGLPPTVRIGYKDYRLIAMGVHEAHDVSRFGEHSSTCATIRILFDAPGRHAPQNLLHEILHAIFYQQGLDDDDVEERTVTCLSRGLAACVRDNPAVFLWIATGLINEPGSPTV